MKISLFMRSKYSYNFYFKISIFFMFIFIDSIIQYCLNSSTEEVLNENNTYDTYEPEKRRKEQIQLNKLDEAISPYIFLFYDNLNYITYSDFEGLSLGENIPEELFEYNYNLGLTEYLHNIYLEKDTNLLIKDIIKNDDFIKTNRLNNINFKINDIASMNYMINRFNFLMYNNRNYYCNNFLLYNLDRSFVYFNVNK